MPTDHFVTLRRKEKILINESCYFVGTGEPLSADLSAVETVAHAALLPLQQVRKTYVEEKCDNPTLLNYLHLTKTGLKNELN